MGRAGKVSINGELAEEDDEPRLATPLHKPSLCGCLHVGADAEIAEQQRSFVTGEPGVNCSENQTDHDATKELSHPHDISPSCGRSPRSGSGCLEMAQRGAHRNKRRGERQRGPYAKPAKAWPIIMCDLWRTPRLQRDVVLR